MNRMVSVQRETKHRRRMCVWEGCDRAAAVEVLEGDVGRRRQPHGHYCVPHSVITSRVLREDHGADVWFTVIADDGRRT